MKKDLKNLRYHYLVTIRRTMNGIKPGKLVLDSFFSYENDKIKNAEKAFIASQNKLIPISEKESSIMYDCFECISYVNLYKKRCIANNNMIMCHFASEFKINIEDIEMIVENSNKCESSMRILEEARVF